MYRKIWMKIIVFTKKNLKKKYAYKLKKKK